MKTTGNYEKKNRKNFRIVPLPIGYKNTACPKCGSLNLSGALLTSQADEQDPNIVCRECGKWVDEEEVH